MPSSWSEAFGLGGRRRAAALLLATLAGCGGGTDGDAPEQVRELNAVVVHAEATVPGYTNDPSIGVYGSAGLFRVGQYQGYTQRHVAKLDALSGPYAVGLRSVSDTTGQPRTQVSLAFDRGDLNLSALTTLSLAQALAQDPSAWFATLSAGGDASLTELTPERLAEARPALWRELRRSLGLALPETLADVFSTPFEAVAGDPMYDALQQLEAAFAARATDVFIVARSVAEQAARCQVERLAVGGGVAQEDFCPARKSVTSDESAPQVSEWRFETVDGVVLTVHSRERTVLDATLEDGRTASRYACQGAACAGLRLGAPKADGTRALVFDGLSLRGVQGTSGRRQLDGGLAGARPGPNFPTLPCADRFQIARSATDIASACAAPDSILGVGAGDAGPVGGARRLYTFRSDGTVEPAAPTLEVRAEGETLVSLFVQDLDPLTGALRARYQCRGEACGRVTIGPARDDLDSFAPYILRRRLITVDDAVLPAVGPDGEVLAGDPVIVRALVDSFEIVYPPELPLVPVPEPCASPAQRVLASLPYGDTPLEVCPPTLEADPSFGYNYFLDSLADGAGGTTLFIGYGNVGTTPGGGVTIRLDGEQLVSVMLQESAGAAYACHAAACRGVTVRAPDAQGRRAVQFSGTGLQEVESAGLPGDRTAVLDGAFETPPPRGP